MTDGDHLAIKWQKLVTICVICIMYGIGVGLIAMRCNRESVPCAERHCPRGFYPQMASEAETKYQVCICYGQDP